MLTNIRKNLSVGSLFSKQREGLPDPALGPSVYAGSAVINLLALALPLAILQIYDRVLPNAAFDTLSVMIAALAGVLIIDMILKYCRTYFINWTAAAYTHKLSSKALKAMMSAAPSRHGRATVSEHLERLNSVHGLGDYLGGQSRVVSIDILFIPIFAGVIILIGGPIFFAPLLLFAVFGYFAMQRTKRLSETIEEKEEQDSRKYDFIIEALQGVQTVKSLAMEPLMMRRFERLQASSSVVVRRLIALTGETQNFSALYASMSAATIVCVGALLVLNGQLTIGGLACCMLLSSQLLQPLLRSLSAWNESQLAGHRRERIKTVFNQAPGADEEAADEETPFPYNRNFSPKSVALENVTIRRGEGEPLFRKLSLSVPAGATVALRGEDGSGRTSLLRAIMGDVAPSEGFIRIDQRPATSMSASQQNPYVRYVGQTPTAFRGSILENLTLFGALPTASALWASRLIGLDNEVIRMPLGYDTPLRSASGRDIPAATAQRICIARALATKPSVLILDEANSALDWEGERFLIDALKELRGSITIILATHRPSLIALADTAYDVRNRALAPIERPAAQQQGGRA